MTRETYPAIFEKFKDWLPLSEEERKAKKLPLNRREFSICHGVNQNTLSVWAGKIEENGGEPDIHDLDTYLLHLRKRAYAPKATAKDRELYPKILGWLEKERLEGKKEELTPSDIINSGKQIINGFKESYRTGGGSCPVCGRLKEVRLESRLDTEPEQPEDREVAAVAVPARPD
jgi:hypothetical protein